MRENDRESGRCGGTMRGNEEEEPGKRDKEEGPGKVMRRRDQEERYGGGTREKE